MARKASIGKTADPQDPLIDGFLQAISAMRAASPNTLAAYRRDLFDCQMGLAKNGHTLAACDADELRAVLSWWHQRQLSPRSVRKAAKRVTSIYGLGCRRWTSVG